MSRDIENPESNALKSGISDAQLEEAIRKSGYPLQIDIANFLHSNFFVEEEWGFRDVTSGTVRTLDLMAERSFQDSDPNRFRVRPTLNLLVECKQSDLPYVFFLGPSTRLRNYPRLVGLADGKITVTTDDDRSTWSVAALDALGLSNDVFFSSASVCATFSKCVRQGKDIELSGSDAYNALVMPLISAAADFESRSKPPSTAYYFFARAVLAVAVLDAPMVGVGVSSDGVRTVSFVPWVRLIRRAPPTEPGFDPHNGEHLIIDIVHKDYFKSFLDRHVVPFMTRFRDGAHKHHEELAAGKGFASSMGRDWGGDLEARLQPSTFSMAPPLQVSRGWRGIDQTAMLLARWATGAVLFRFKRPKRR